MPGALLLLVRDTLSVVGFLKPGSGREDEIRSEFNVELGREP